jgi:hypothetical protein
MIPASDWACAECGFEGASLDRAEIPGTIRGFARRYAIPLTRGLAGEDLDALLRERPAARGWSALEYACHSRDVFLVTDHRVRRVMEEDGPRFRRVDPDQGAADLDYNGQDPATVVREIEAATAAVAERLDALTSPEWDRAGTRDGQALTVDVLARNAVHEGVHHLLDIGRTLRGARGR